MAFLRSLTRFSHVHVPFNASAPANTLLTNLLSNPYTMSPLLFCLAMFGITIFLPPWVPPFHLPRKSCWVLFLTYQDATSSRWSRFGILYSTRHIQSLISCMHSIRHGAFANCTCSRSFEWKNGVISSCDAWGAHLTPFSAPDFMILSDVKFMPGRTPSKCSSPSSTTYLATQSFFCAEWKRRIRRHAHSDTSASCSARLEGWWGPGFNKMDLGENCEGIG